jgi:predicted NBD/HSP70 family sugar kinase
MFSQPQRQLLQTLSEHGPRSRTELAAMMQMSKAAVTGFTRALLERGLLQETEIVHRIGRPSVRLGLDPGSAFFLGVSLAQNPARMVLADLAGTPVAHHAIPWAPVPDEVADGIATGLSHILREHPIYLDRIEGIGLAVPGFVDDRQQTVVQSTLLGWEAVAVAALVHARTGIPSAVENDAKAIAVAERLFGTARDRRCFTIVSVGDGIGCAHVVDGRLHRGHDGGAGEIAHVTIEPGGAPCRCGKRGCLDAIASLAAVIAAAAEDGLTVGSRAELERLAAQGNEAAIRIITRAGTALGLAIAQVIQINNPMRILVAHVDGALDGLLGEVMRRVIAENILPRLRTKTEIVLFDAPADLWARGAAGFAADRFLNGFETPAGHRAAPL